MRNERERSCTHALSGLSCRHQPAPYCPCAERKQPSSECRQCHHIQSTACGTSLRLKSLQTFTTSASIFGLKMTSGLTHATLSVVVVDAVVNNISMCACVSVHNTISFEQETSELTDVNQHLILYSSIFTIEIQVYWYVLISLSKSMMGKIKKKSCFRP